jgi:hypothetical protein
MRTFSLIVDPKNTDRKRSGGRIFFFLAQIRPHTFLWVRSTEDPGLFHIPIRMRHKNDNGNNLDHLFDHVQWRCSL